MKFFLNDQSSRLAFLALKEAQLQAILQRIRSERKGGKY